MPLLVALAVVSWLVSFRSGWEQLSRALDHIAELTKYPYIIMYIMQQAT